jgi:hypothetical protein
MRLAKKSLYIWTLEKRDFLFHFHFESCITMKKLFISLILCVLSFGTYSQTATDFTAISCDGTDYHLFSELDSSKVVVICWAMPCGGCIEPLQTTFNVVQSYQDSLPGMVNMLICDDFANTDCSALTLWAKSYGMENTLKFSDSSIKMSDYGEAAMPKVVVAAGSGHQVFFMSDYSVDGKMLEKAIDSAVTMITGLSEYQLFSESVSVFPNPADENVSISFELQKSGEMALYVVDEYGHLVLDVMNGFRKKGKQEETISTLSLKNGLYFVVIKSESGSISRKISVIH